MLSGVNVIAASSCCVGGESKSPGVTSRAGASGGPPTARRRRDAARSRATRPSAGTAAASARARSPVVSADFAPCGCSCPAIDTRRPRTRSRRVGREDHRRLHAAGDFRELPDVAAVGVGQVDLHVAVAVEDEREALAVGRPARRVLGLVAADEQLRRAGPSAGTIQMSALRFPVATSVVVRTNATDLPSGDSCGSDTRTVPMRSVMVIGRPVCAVERA